MVPPSRGYGCELEVSAGEGVDVGLWRFRPEHAAWLEEHDDAIFGLPQQGDSVLFFALHESGFAGGIIGGFRRLGLGRKDRRRRGVGMAGVLAGRIFVGG